MLARTPLSLRNWMAVFAVVHLKANLINVLVTD